jgi:hypothetical protein
MAITPAPEVAPATESAAVVIHKGHMVRLLVLVVATPPDSRLVAAQRCTVQPLVRAP